MQAAAARTCTSVSINEAIASTAHSIICFTGLSENTTYCRGAGVALFPFAGARLFLTATCMISICGFRSAVATRRRTGDEEEDDTVWVDTGWSDEADADDAAYR